MLAAIITALVEALVAQLPAIEESIGRANLLRELEGLAQSIANAALIVANFRQKLAALEAGVDGAIKTAEDRLKAPPAPAAPPEAPPIAEDKKP